MLDRIIREMGGTVGPDGYGFAGLSSPYFEGVTPEAVRSLIQDAIEETASRGNVVIVSHAASLALSAKPNVLRVLVTASPETRARRLSEARGLDPKDARKTITDADGARAHYLRRFHGVEVELPTHYDLVVNTDTLSVEQAAELVAQAARWRGSTTLGTTARVQARHGTRVAGRRPEWASGRHGVRLAASCPNSTASAPRTPAVSRRAISTP